MSNTQQKEAKRFSQRWAGRGKEEEDKQKYWIDLLMNVFGWNDIEDIKFEVKIKTVKYKDKKDVVLFPKDSDKRVLIEQKSRTVPLDRKNRQSDGSNQTAFEQAKKYDDLSAYGAKARWIITCNFQEFWIYDMEKEGAAYQEPVKLKLEDLSKHLDWLAMLKPGKTDGQTVDFSHQEEVEVSDKAAQLIGDLYDSIKEQYNDDKYAQDLNKLCVRLVFCLYAEDSELFQRQQFYNYLKPLKPKDIRLALKELFAVLDAKDEDRHYLTDELKAFPYVNGGLFADEIEIPMFTDEQKTLLLEKASAGFDWSKINPTIFGAMFESTLAPQKKTENGMYYTSIENIEKIINPLFLDDLEVELNSILAFENTNTRRLKNFQNKLASIKVLDPACGSGNFLTQTYTRLRKMENKVIFKLNNDGIAFDQDSYFIKVSIGQLYGFEKDDFAVTVAKTALWIAESQMAKETEKILWADIDFLPLKTNSNIIECNALKEDWSKLVPANELNYIIGNPPFYGAKKMSKEQRAELKETVGAKVRGVGNLDYCVGWYHKSAHLMQENPKIRTALVATNSITQGQQVAPCWGKLIKAGFHIDFAYRSFIWNNTATDQAHVYCVIVSFSKAPSQKVKFIYDGKEAHTASNISPYLYDGDSVVVEPPTQPLCSVPPLTQGNQMLDGGNFILSEEEKDSMIARNPQSSIYIHNLVGAKEFLHRDQKRYCIWLRDVSPAVYVKDRNIMNRIDNIKQLRLKSPSSTVRRAAEYPAFSGTYLQHGDHILVLPRHSSQKRAYIPMAFAAPGDIIADSCCIICDASLYVFGVLNSSVHMAWVRAIVGRIKVDFRYSKDLYNSFVWPQATEEQKERIMQTAQGILDARANHPDLDLATMYNDDVMPPDLKKAHKENNKAVMSAYGFDASFPEIEIVKKLMALYQKATSNKQH